MNRRHFLRAGSALSLPLFLNKLPLQAAPSSLLASLINPDSDRVLVLVQLNGGNDGLNTLIPLDQYDNLAALRSNLLLPESSLLNLSATNALHPAMSGMSQLFSEGKLGVVQGVGYPEQNRSHFRSTDIWTSGSASDEVDTTGWLGRYLLDDYPDYPEGYPNPDTPDPIAITMGTVVSETCQTPGFNFSLTVNDPFSQTSLFPGGDTPVPDNYYGEELSFLRTTMAQTNTYGQIVLAAAEAGNSLVEYPDTRLAEQLKNVAYLISGGLQTKIYIVNLGGFDTHANQAVESDPTTGTHAELLGTLSGALAAFQADLTALGLEERVVGMTFSEFGRRIRSNDALGTDHGSAAPLFLFGPCVQDGIMGENSPLVADEIDSQTGMPMQFDFRDIYGSILVDWFEADEERVRNILHPEFTYLPVLSPCGETPNAVRRDGAEDFPLNVAPNPSDGTFLLRFTATGAPVRLFVYDQLGRLVMRPRTLDLAAGERQVPLRLAGHAPGTYLVRLEMDGAAVSKRVVLLGR